MDIYHLFILFISIGLIENASIQAEEHKRIKGRVFKGGDCEYIMISGITANTGCDSGNKFVIKQQTGVRKQFLVLNGEPIMAFINRWGLTLSSDAEVKSLVFLRGKKFTQCDSYTEITSSVVCKVNLALNTVNYSVDAYDYRR